ncbi:MAG: pyridoxamine 5'-phosphate oxidase family protein [Actinomycetota bacterium]
MTPPPLPEALTDPMARGVRLLLDSRIPVRLAWTAHDASPRVAPLWHHWDGETLAMATFAGAKKLRGIADGDVLAATIDTEQFPYRSLTVRGPVTLEPTDGLADEYRQAAARFVGPVAGAQWCAFLGEPDQVVIRLRPTFAQYSDMASSPFVTTSPD